MKKSVISLILVLAFLLSVLPPSACAAATNEDEIMPVDDSPPHEHVLNVGCQAAIDANVGSNPIEFVHTLSAKNGVLQLDGEPVSKGTVIIYSSAASDGSFPISAYVVSAGSYYLTTDCGLNAPIVFNGEGTVNLCLNGHQITRNNSDGTIIYSLIYVENGNFNLCDCSGRGAVAHGDVHNESSWLQYGGGIHIASGAFTMFSGNITNNQARYGGGIYMSNGTITMYGGTISGNTSTHYVGGGIFISSGTVTMYGGTITKNTAKNGGGGVFINSSGSFILQGGTITGNLAGTSPSDGYGGGIYSSGTFEMYGGTISGNTAANNGGGGGIYINSSSATMDGGTISDNTAGGSGGGVYLYSGSLEMTGGEITGNKASASGAGIDLSAGTNLHLSGGTITSNEITSVGDSANGAGISGSGNVYLSGSPVVYDNKKGDAQNNLYLPTGNQVNFEAGKTLSSGAQIGITTQNTPDSGNPVQIFNPENAQKEYVNYFIADKSESFHVAWDESSNSLKLFEGKTVHSHTGNANTFESALNTLTGSLSNGSYYLTKDITLTGTVTISGTVSLCLNGHSISGPASGSAFMVPNGAVLNVYNNCVDTGGFAGLSGSGGIQVENGGRLDLFGKNDTSPTSYAPTTGTGGTVTFGDGGTVSRPISGVHTLDHPDPSGAFQAINAGNLSSFVEACPPDISTPGAYRLLKPGKYYLESNFKMPYALIVTAPTDFCLNGSDLGADNDTWLYEMQHVFLVQNKTVLNVVDCRRDLHIIWLYGGQVYLKGGAAMTITGTTPGYITTIEMAEDSEGEVTFEYDEGGNPVIFLPEGATLTQKADNKVVQTITKNDDGTLTMTTYAPDDAGNPTPVTTTTITPPAGKPIGLTLPEAPPDEKVPSAVTLEAPAGTKVQTDKGTEKGPVITLEQPGEVAPDGEVTSRSVTVRDPDPDPGQDPGQDQDTKKEITVTAPEGKTVTVDPDSGEVEFPEGSKIKKGDVVMEVKDIPGGGSGTVTPDSGSGTSTPGGSGGTGTPGGGTGTSTPTSNVTLPGGSTVEVSDPKKESATIVISLPGGGGGNGGTIGLTGQGVKPPKGSTVNVKPKKEDATIVISLPDPPSGGGSGGGGGGDPPEIKFSTTGALVLPEGTTVTPDGGTPQTVTGKNNTLDPDTGKLVGPVNSNEPEGTPVGIPADGTSVEKGDVTVKQDNTTGEIIVTPKDDPTNPDDSTKPTVTITPKTPATPGADSPKVDDKGNVFVDGPFEVTTDDGDGDDGKTTVTAEKGGSVKPDGTVTGEVVTVEEKKPDGPTGETKTTYKAPDGDAVVVNPDGSVDVPPGSEITKDNTTVRIDKTDDLTQPVKVDPDGGFTAEAVTVTQKNPDGTTESEVKITAPDGNEVTVNPDGSVDVPPGGEVTKDDITVTIDKTQDTDPTKPVKVDPDGSFPAKEVTVTKENPDGTTESEVKVTAPDGGKVTVNSDGSVDVPPGSEVTQGNTTVTIDTTPDPTKPVKVDPDGSTDVPPGGKVTITVPDPTDPTDPDQKKEYKVELPQGGDIKVDPETGKITVPPGAVISDPDNPNSPTTVGPNGGTLDPTTGAITNKPNNPSNPDSPNNPDNPDNPDNPSNPSNPSNPGGNNPGSDPGGSGGSDNEDKDEEESGVVTVSASIGGMVSPGKRVPGDHGDDLTFTITPDEGYVIQDVLVDGKSVGPVTSYTFKDVRGRHTIQALFVAEGMLGTGIPEGCPRDETCPIRPYKDSTPTKWYHDGVHYCIENKLMVGTDRGQWEPDIPLSRAMMAQVLYNKAGKPAVSGAGVFDDVDQKWYWPAITWGSRNEVLLGYGNGNYGPQDPITREQLATLLWRYAGRPEADGVLKFSDADDVSDYAVEALCWANQHGIILGYEDGTLRPRGKASRAEAAQMIMRYFTL